MKKIVFLVIFSVILLIPFIAKGTVVISEIMYDLSDSDDSREWVEIFNNSATSMDLTGWKFWENGTNHGLTLVQGDINIQQNGYAIIADNPDKFLIDNPGYSGILFDSTFSLSNSGENLIVKDKSLTVIDQVLYSSSWGASGNGRSLQRKDPNGNSNDPADWGSGNPTPGIINNISVEEPASTSEEPTTEQPETSPTTSTNQPPIADAGNNIVAFIDEEITFDGSKSHDPDGNDLAYEWNLGEGGVENDVLVTHKYSFPGTYLVALMVFDGKYYVKDTITVEIYPKKITINEFLPSPTGKDDEEEWIELYNDSDQIIDISGWQLDDEDGGSKTFIFPKNTLIFPYGYLVISRKVSGLSLNNDKDKVRLLLSSGIVFQEITYEKAPEGKSSARTPEGFVWSMPTPGLANITGSFDSQGLTDNKPLETFNAGNASENMVLYSKNATNSTSGGWIALSQSNAMEKNQQQYYNLANIKESGSSNNKQALIIAAIILIIAVAAVGILKFKKKI